MIQKSVALSIFALSLAGLQACGDGKFSGDAAKVSPAQASPSAGTGEANPADGSQTKVPEAGDVDGGRVVVEKPSEKDLESINKCSKGWGLTPGFNKESVRKIYASVSVLSSGTTLSDKQVTAEPALTLIYAAVNVISDVEWDLLNPNGWYCIVANVNVITDLTVNINEK
ncbi:MAG: hypothetical protein V4655_04325, partial [Bdellovibrionota bacterium]